MHPPCKAIVLLALALASGAVFAQSYPARPVRVVIGFPPGGGIDIVARMLAPKLHESLGQPIVVDNRAGANGIIAIETVHVPYKGSAPGLSDLIGGHVQFGFDAVAIGLPHVRAGRLRAVAATGPRRLSFLQDVPSASETVPGFEVVNWYGMVAPAGTPRAVIARLHAEIVRAQSIPDIREKLIAQATDPVGSTPGEFGAFRKAEEAKWARVIKEANIRPD